MEAYLDWQSKSAGIKLNDVIEENRYVANGKSVKEGDFLTYVGEDVAPAIEPPFNAIALSDGVGAPEYVEGEVLIEGNIIPTQSEWTKISDTEYVSTNGTRVTSSALYYPSGENLINAFDGDDTTDCRLGSNIINWIKLEFPEPISIAEMYVSVDLSNVNFTVFVQASNDDLVWDTLATKTADFTGTIETGLTSSQKYKFYKLQSYCANANLFTQKEWRTTKYYKKALIPSTEHNEQVKIARVYKEIIHTDNIFAKTWESIANGYKYKSSDGYVLEASSCAHSTNYPTNYACDNDTSTSWRGESRAQDWLKLTLPQPVRITKMKTYITLSSSEKFEQAIIQGSNVVDATGSDWVKLYVLSEAQTALSEIELENNNEYMFYRILIETNGYTPIVYEWQVSEWLEVIQ